MRGYVFAEASLSVTIVAMAALPLALLATTGLDTARQQRAVLDLARVTAAAAEHWPGHDSRGASLARCGTLHADAACAPGERLVVGTSLAPPRPSLSPTMQAAALPRVALWIAP
ncbi:hypothetical protein [Cupriavidus sp. OTU4895]|uniref:hypothetical protein n=1 Tax=Cupriavidus sp. OTU4895 TaxID=3043852 RepID=UPI00313D22E7